MLTLYNSLTRKKEQFQAQKDGKVAMYNCGPTVYDYAHIGNLRTFLFADILRRYLEWSGYRVKQVMNITDVGHMVADADTGTDKLEAAAAREQKTPWEIAEYYTKAFFRDIDALNIQRAWKYPRATDHVKEMIQIIKILLKRGFAYEVNGSVYFDLSKFPKWGALSGNKLEDLQAGARVEIKEEKRHPSDFALWIENPKHVMQWKAPWSRVAGYPGWHIECSAMSMKYLGETIDIHTGGEDNKFPHHESEIAQSESSTGNPFARYWLHTKHLLVDGKKMSKSLGNFYTLADLEKKGFDPREVRYLLISTHYRDEMNFTLDGLRAAGEALNRLDEFAAKLAAVAKDRKRKADTPAAPEEVIARARTDFQAAMDDDLNVSKALAGVFSFVKKLNSLLARQNFSSRDARLALVFLQECGGVFGFNFGEKEVEEIPPEVKKLVQEREEARVAKDWKRADELREKIGKLGYEVEDVPGGWKIKKKRSA
ncbi:MAG: cysteine--tRNA ligase [Patescibacteria group bacterium]